jgi:hypothetical protein
MRQISLDGKRSWMTSACGKTGDRHKYYDDIRDELYREMDQAESSFVYSSWIPGTIWPEPYDKIFWCLGTGDHPGQWNVARWFYGLILQDVIIYRTDQQWEAFAKTDGRRLNRDPEGTLYRRIS